MNTGKPNIGAVMVNIHKAITRGLEVSGERSASFVQMGYPDVATQVGFVTYARTLGWMINAHHLAEDHVVFPYLRTRLPDAPYDELSADHRKVEAILEKLQAAVEAVGARAQAGEALNELNRSVFRLTEIWHPHIAKEQLYLYDTAKTEAVMDEGEQVKLIAATSEYSLQQADPAFLVPFILFNLPPGARTEIAQLMPQAVIQNMVPVVWKEKWSPMEPFLLD